MSVKPVPDGFNTVNAFLVLKDARAALDFYAKAFGAEGISCMEGPDGSVMHAEIRIGNSTVMVCQENPQWQLKSAETLGGSPVSLHLYVKDADALYKQAIAAGCTEAYPMNDAFWGDRYGKVIDPYGLQWGIATHVEDVSEAEMKRRQQEFFASMGADA